MDFLELAQSVLQITTGNDPPDVLAGNGAFAAAAALIAIAERLDTIIDRLGEPIDSHPADLAERAGKGECPDCGEVWFECKCYSGCGEDIEQHEAGCCPLCQRTWAECDCAAQNYHKALR